MSQARDEYQEAQNLIDEKVAAVYEMEMQRPVTLGYMHRFTNWLGHMSFLFAFFYCAALLVGATASPTIIWLSVASLLTAIYNHGHANNIVLTGKILDARVAIRAAEMSLATRTIPIRKASLETRHKYIDTMKTQLDLHRVAVHGNCVYNYVRAFLVAALLSYL